MDKKTRPIYMLCTRDSLQTRHTQTESEEMERYFMQLIRIKEQALQYLYLIKQTVNKESHKRQGRTLHNDNIYIWGQSNKRI